MNPSLFFQGFILYQSPLLTSQTLNPSHLPQNLLCSFNGREDINPYDVKAIGNYLKNLGQATQVLYAVKNREELAASDDLSCTPL
ncbi:MAG TPA: hypothetical protein EYP18_09680 [Desulfobacterales bacterium]|nr:hypothetical protein [Desulfobacterales bacterium]